MNYRAIRARGIFALGVYLNYFIERGLSIDDLPGLSCILGKGYLLVCLRDWRDCMVNQPSKIKLDLIPLNDYDSFSSKLVSKLSEPPPTDSLAALIRERYQDIVSALDRGYSLEQIAQILRELVDSEFASAISARKVSALLRSLGYNPASKRKKRGRKSRKNKLNNSENLSSDLDLDSKEQFHRVPESSNFLEKFK